MKKSTSSKFKQISKIFILLLLVITLVALIVITTDNKHIKNIKEFINEDTKVLYITNKNKYSKYVRNLFDKYDAKYMYIDSSSLSNIEKKKIEKIVNNNNLSNLIVIFENGEIKGSLIDNSKKNNINEFLQKNNIIPEVIGDNKNIISSVENLLETDFTLIFIPYKYINGIDSQNNILKSISDKYNINYKMINAYLLSDIQKEKLNKILNISPVDEQIIVLIKNKKIVGNIRNIQTFDEYIEKLKELKFIEDIKNYIKEINYEDFNNIIDSKEKSIILIDDNTCKYCDEIKQVLNPIIIEYGIDVNYINIGDIDSELSKSILGKLKEIGYDDAYTFPITIMVEYNKILNYVIGPSTEKYFVDVFTENGIIK